MFIMNTYYNELYPKATDKNVKGINNVYNAVLGSLDCECAITEELLD